MNNNEFEVGFTACYVHDFSLGGKRFSRTTEILPDVALQWAQDCAPDSIGGIIKTFGDMKSGNEWVNKLFVIVEANPTNRIALYNHDGKFYVYTLTVT